MASTNVCVKFTFKSYVDLPSTSIPTLVVVGRETLKVLACEDDLLPTRNLKSP